MGTAASMIDFDEMFTALTVALNLGDCDSIPVGVVGPSGLVYAPWIVRSN